MANIPAYTPVKGDTLDPLLFEVLARRAAGSYVAYLSAGYGNGCSVHAATPASTSIVVDAGSIYVAGLPVAVGGATVALAGYIDSSNPKIVVIYADGSGTIQVQDGTAQATAIASGGNLSDWKTWVTPYAATPPTGVILAKVRLDAGETAIAAGDIQILALPGQGSVLGPASATDGDLVAFDGVTGKLAKDSSITMVNAASAVSLKHTQGTDQKLDDGGVNEVTAAQLKTVVNKTLPSGALVGTTDTQTLSGKTLTSPKINDGDAGCTITSANQTNAGATVTIPDMGDAADEMVLKDTTQTLTAKTLTSPHLDTPLVDDYLDINEESAPSAPGAGVVRIYAKTDHKIYKNYNGGSETEIGSGSGGSFGVYHNLIYNGQFQVNQQAITQYTSATVPANSDDTYAAPDGWNLLSDGNDIVDVYPEATVIPTGAPSSLKLEVETANKKFGIVQFVESKDARKYAGKYASLQFKARTTTGKVIRHIRAAVLSWSSTADTITSDVVSAWNAEGANPTFATNWTAENTAADLTLVADTWTTYKIENIYVDTASMTNLAVFIWCDDADAAVDDLLYVGDVQLNEGMVCLPYAPRDFITELMKSKRYWLKSYSYGAAPGTIGTVEQEGSVAVIRPSSGVPADFGGCLAPVLYGVEMRTVGTITFYSPISGASGKMYDVLGPVDVDAIGAHGIGPHGFNMGGDGITAGHIGLFQYTVDARF